MGLLNLGPADWNVIHEGAHMLPRPHITAQDREIYGEIASVSLL